MSKHERERERERVMWQAIEQSEESGVQLRPQASMGVMGEGSRGSSGPERTDGSRLWHSSSRRRASGSAPMRESSTGEERRPDHKPKPPPKYTGAAPPMIGIGKKKGGTAEPVSHAWRFPSPATVMDPEQAVDQTWRLNLLKVCAVVCVRGEGGGGSMCEQPCVFVYVYPGMMAEAADGAEQTEPTHHAVWRSFVLPNVLCSYERAHPGRVRSRC